MHSKYFNIHIIFFLLVLCITNSLNSQTATLKGFVKVGSQPVSYANVTLVKNEFNAITDSMGNFIISNLPAGKYLIQITAVGYENFKQQIILSENENKVINIDLLSKENALQDVVISGTMKPVSRSESPVPVEVYSARFFKSNPTPSIFDAMQNVNGVRPQINCNVCNTGDIHINGLEGPYTMILIDGMPIVSGLSTVYGLSGIPQSLIERVEVVKGPASTLYGSEAVGGLINVITKKTNNAPIFSADIFGTGWGEVSTDIASKFNAGKKVEALIGLNYYNFQNTVDNNKDNFTDLTLQNRISVFNKWNFRRNENRVFTVAGRYVYEDRWGGDVNWSKQFRGGDSVYGESIYTSRWEIFGTYQLPVKEKILIQFSANSHDQNSYYGNTPYFAQQNIGFGQLVWDKQLKNNDLLFGASYRYTWYDDNTPATSSVGQNSSNKPSVINLPGIFLQDEIRLNDYNKLLVGMRYDYNSIHGSILTPRVNYKWSSHNKKNVLRVSVGNGYRVANVFTEDHAALTGAREVVFLEDLNPETSWNGNINFTKKIYTKTNTFIGLDASAFYTYFSNRIIADYETDPNKIIYDNLQGYAISKGVSVNVDIAYISGLKILAGATLMDVSFTENNITTRQLFTEKFTGVWSVGYTIRNIGLSIDYTGNVYSPMRLPLLNDLDPRKENSPWWSIQNIQFTKKFSNSLEIYGGIKNLLNWTPNKGNPFIISRTNDPFDKEVEFDTNGQIIATANNPYALSFDPTYVYGPNQGARGFLGFRYSFSK